MPATILVPRYRRRDRLIQSVLDSRPTALWWMRDAAGPLRDIAGNHWDATVTGSPLYGVGAREPIGRGVTWPGGSVYATTATNIPTPTSSVSALMVWNTADASAAFRTALARAAPSQHSWTIRLHTSHVAQFLALQSSSTTHATASTTGATNDGNWHLAVGSFDGTTIRCGRDAAAAVTSTSLTGSWHTASTAAVQVGAHNSANSFIGTTAHLAYWADRVITDAERLQWYAYMAGG